MTDYFSILSTAIDYTQKEYSNIVADKVRDQAGFEVKGNYWM
jgi:hypothetical protein